MYSISHVRIHYQFKKRKWWIEKLEYGWMTFFIPQTTDVEMGGLKNWNMEEWFFLIPQATDIDVGKNAWRKSDCDSWPNYINISYVSAWANAWI